MPAVNLCWAFPNSAINKSLFCGLVGTILRFTSAVTILSLSLSLSLSLKKADLYEDVEHEEELTTLYQGSALRAIC